MLYLIAYDASGSLKCRRVRAKVVLRGEHYIEATSHKKAALESVVEHKGRNRGDARTRYTPEYDVRLRVVAAKSSRDEREKKCRTMKVSYRDEGRWGRHGGRMGLPRQDPSLENAQELCRAPRSLLSPYLGGTATT